MDTKVCTGKKCIHSGQPQPRDNFHNHSSSPDGKTSWCKDCKRAWGQKYKTTKSRKATLKKYNASEKAKASRKRYEKSEKGKAANKRYAESPKGKAVAQRQYEKAKASKDYYKRRSAYTYIQRMIEKGNIPHTSDQVCQICGEQASHYHHINGYEKAHRLDVIPLCVSCHHDISD